jgi:D-sedoheptulose 7-phosphate isomerase
METKQKGCMTEAQLAKVIEVHRKTGRRLGWAAVELGFIGKEELLKALSAQLSLPYLRLSPKPLNGEVVGLIPELVARRRHMIPVERTDDRHLVLAMADPLDQRSRREAGLITGMEIEVVITLESEITACLDHFYGPGRPDTEPQADAFHKKIGEFLLEGGFITQEQLQTALERQRSNGSRLGIILVEMGVISEENWMQALGMQLDMPYVHLASYGLDSEIVRTIPEALARHYCLVPIARQLNVLVTAMADPQDEVARTVIQGKTGYNIRPVISSTGAIGEALDGIYGQPARQEPGMAPPEKRIGEYLVEGGFITSRQLDLALERQRQTPENLPTAEEFCRHYFSKLETVLAAIPAEKIDRIVEMLLDAYRQDRHIFIMGNGGSASNASHFACDLAKTPVSRTGHRVRAMSLTENLPLLTAWSNDTHYYFGFVEQLKNLMNSGDVVIGISGSGNSQNVLNGIAYANSIGGKTIGLIGFSGGKLKDLAEESLTVPSDNMQRVEDVHLVLVHLISTYLRHRIEAWQNESPEGQGKDPGKGES